MKKIIFLIIAMLLLASCKPEHNDIGSGKVFFPVYNVTAPASGKVLGLILKEGDRISKEQPLFAIEDTSLDAQIKEAAVNSARAEAELKAMQNGGSAQRSAADTATARARLQNAAENEQKMARLYKIGAIARRQYEQAAAEKAAAEAALSAASAQSVKASPEEIKSQEEKAAGLKQKYNGLLQQQLMLEAESPCTGIVAKIYISSGQGAVKGEQVLSIRDLENCSATVKVSAQAAEALKPGQKLIARAESINKNFNATVVKIEAGSLTVNIDNSSLSLKDGMEVAIIAAK